MSRVIFGRKGLGVPTPLLVKTILKWLKRVCLAATALSGMNQHEYLSFAFVSLAWFFDEVEPLFGVAAEIKDDIIEPKPTV